MNTHVRNNARDLRAATELVVSATQGVTQAVQQMHTTIASGPAVLGAPLSGPARLFTGLVYGQVRGVTGLVGVGLDKALEALSPWLGESTPGPERDAVVAALNGVLGDHLAASGSPLAIPMTMRSEGTPLELTPDALRAQFPDASGKVLVLVHGSSMADRGWLRRGHDHGAALAKDLGVTPVYLHYNSGLHVSENGRAFAALLEELYCAWPVPITELTILSHSMGGLVARSACREAEAAALSWRPALHKLVFLGTPHHGSPLERGGNLLHTLLGVSRYSKPLARLARIRSAGVTDLRYGNLCDEDWREHDRFEPSGDTRRAVPLPAGVSCYAVAGSTGKVLGEAALGDGLVPVDSALGKHPEPPRTLGFPEDNTWVALGTDHLGLLYQPQVYERLRTWLG